MILTSKGDEDPDGHDRERRCECYKEGYGTIRARINFLGVHSEHALLKKNNVSHSIVVTCIKGMIYSHKCGRKKDHAKVCNLLHLVKKISQKPCLKGESRGKKTLTATLSFRVAKAKSLVALVPEMFKLLTT